MPHNKNTNVDIELNNVAAASELQTARVKKGIASSNTALFFASTFLTGSGPRNKKERNDTTAPFVSEEMIKIARPIIGLYVSLYGGGYGVGYIVSGIPGSFSAGGAYIVACLYVATLCVFLGRLASQEKTAKENQGHPSVKMNLAA